MTNSSYEQYFSLPNIKVEKKWNDLGGFIKNGVLEEKKFIKEKAKPPK